MRRGRPSPSPSSSLVLLLLLFLSSPLISVSTITTPVSQILSLRALYYETNGPFWEWKNEVIYGTPWPFNSTADEDLPDSDPCHSGPARTWQGITCSQGPNQCKITSCNITVINLKSYHLVGTLPPEIFQLNTLKTLALSSNSLRGTFPTQIVLLSNLQTIQLTDNSFVGSIPDIIELLPNVETFQLDGNIFTGTIPSSIGSMSSLRRIKLNSNFLNGTLPSSMSQLTQLIHLELSNNKFTGTIPSFLGLLLRADTLGLSENHFTGPVPSSLGYLERLSYLSLLSNHLNSTLPSSIGCLTKLENFLASSNSFTGSLPSLLMQMRSLEYLSLSFNSFIGTIPPFADFPFLEDIDLSENRFVGRIPSQFGLLPSINIIRVNSNQLSGTISTTFNSLSRLVIFHAHNNLLSGSIPLKLLSFRYLRQLFLQQNKFTGSLDELVSLPNSSTTLKKIPLINFDVSGNELSGTIPSLLFEISSLISVALSVNCFKQSLPSTLCSPSNLEALSLDGLSSAKSCPHQFVIPFTKVSLGNMMTGSIPSCLWKLTTLKEVSIAGNGFTGTIGPIENVISMVNLTLSYNYLNGEIPSQLLIHNFSSLDLSHNKLTGDIWKLQSISDRETKRSHLKLNVNRLSGHLPKTLHLYSSVNILTGNVFGCDNLPQNDKYHDWYVCGSIEFDNTLYAMTVVLSLGIGVAFVYCLSIQANSRGYLFSRKTCCAFRITEWCESRVIEYRLLVQYLTFFLQDSAHIRPQDLNWASIFEFGKILVNLTSVFTIVAVTITFLSIPIYVLKGLANYHYIDNQINSYATHTHQFQWILTTAYFSGAVPGLLILLIGFLSLFVYLYLVTKIYVSKVTDLTSSLSLSRRSISFICLGFFINFIVVATANGIYVWSTLQNLSRLERMLIQLSLSCFGVAWKVLLRSLFPSEVKNLVSGVWLFCCISVVNNVILPCAATALTSPTCYQVWLRSFHLKYSSVS